MAAAAQPKCAICNDTGWNVGAGGARRCECQLDDHWKKFLAAACIPPRYEHCRLETFQYKGSRELENAFVLASGYAANYPNLPDPNRTGLLFYGGVGTGKTHLAVAMAQVLLERGIGCVFTDYRDLLKRIQATFDPNNPATEAGVVAPLLRAEVLILDDLGVGRATDWALETLHYILNHRYSQRLATILTTNLEDLASSMEKREVVLVQAVGERLRSRLYEMCQFAAMHGEDYRQRGLTVPRAGS